jgi:hypothetical protein
MKSLSVMATLLLCLIVVAPRRAQAQYNVDYGTNGQAQNWHATLSSDDQRDFDKYYSKWVDASRKGDRDDIAENARHMQDIMVRNRIPVGVSFDQVASNPAPAYPGTYPNGAYPNGAYPYPAAGQRLSPDDQRKFDKEYEKWVDAQRKNDQDDVAKHAREMEQIMGRYNIASNVPFAAIATNGYAVGPNGAAAYPYPSNGAPAYPYGYGQSAQRLSEKDQKDFDKAYHHWVEARNKRDMDDVDKNERKMREIMARYNIPANVSFDQIASAGAAYR